MTFPRKLMEDQIERIDELADETREMIEERFPGLPIGQEQVDDETFARWYEGKVQASPAVPIQFPDGVTRTMSPWAAALIFVEGGMPIVDRYNQIRGGA